MSLTLRGASISAPVLSVDRLDLRAGSRLLVGGLAFALSAGERLIVTGANGSGKSTLLRALSGLSAPAAGRVTTPPSPPGMLFQDGALWPHMSVEQHLVFVDRGRHLEWREELLTTLRLQSLRRARPERLSGGERVRLGLARALAARPAWLLLDEPLANLDAVFADVLREFLPRCLDELGAAAVIVTHQADLMPLLGARVLCLSGAGPWWLGDTQQALAAPPTPLLAALAGRGNVLSAIADAAGCADFGLGITRTGQPPGSECAVFLDAQSVALAGGERPPARDDGMLRHRAPVRAAGTLRDGSVAHTEGASVHDAEYVAADPRGGGWVRAGGHLLRCTHDVPPPAAGTRVKLLVRGEARPLQCVATARGSA